MAAGDAAGHVDPLAERLIRDDGYSDLDRPHRAHGSAQVGFHLVGMGGAELPQDPRKLFLVKGLVPPDQGQDRAVLRHIEERFDRQRGLDLEQRRHLRDRAGVGGRHLLHGPGGEFRSGRDAPRQLDVGSVAAPLAERHLVLPRGARSHELVGARAAHHAGVRLDDVVAEAAAVEDPAVRLLVGVVGLRQAGLVQVQRVGVLHQELARPEDAGSRPRLVALLGLDLVPDLRQVPVRAELLGGDPGDDLLVGHPQAHVPRVAVLEPEHLGADNLPAARLLPDLRRMEDRQRDFLPADPVHLLPDDRVDLVHHALAQRQIDVDAGRQLAHQARAHHELVADGLGVGRVFPEGRDERPGPAHGATLSRA